MIVFSVVQMVLLLIGYALCIIPGIYLSVAWYFAIPLIIDRRMNFWEAMELSRKMVNKHWIIIFAFLIVYGLLALAGMIACCVGIFVTMPIGFAALMYAMKPFFKITNPLAAPRPRTPRSSTCWPRPVSARCCAGAGWREMATDLSVAGFAWIIVWFFKEMIPYYGLMFNDQTPQLPGLKMVVAGEKCSSSHGCGRRSQVSL